MDFKDLSQLASKVQENTYMIFYYHFSRGYVAFNVPANYRCFTVNGIDKRMATDFGLLVRRNIAFSIL